MLRAVVLAGALFATGSEAGDSFRVDQAQGWPEALALCDLTHFLLDQRELGADVILATDGQTGQRQVLYGPRFLPPNLLYDAPTRMAFFRLQRDGDLSRAEVAEARARLDRPMMRAFRRMSASDRAFLEDQARTCTVLMAGTRQP